MAYLMVPERIFSFPRTAHDQFLLVISLCPFLSVLGQEIAYRLLFFERYGDLIDRVEVSIPVVSEEDRDVLAEIVAAL